MARRRKRNRWQLITVSSSSEVPAACPRYPYYISSAPATFSPTIQANYLPISPANPNFTMAPTVTPLPSVDAPSITRTVGTTRGGLRIEIANPVAQAADDEVVYLYTVNGGQQLVEVVDLAEDTQNQEQNSSNRSFNLATERTPVREDTTNRNSSILHELPEQDVAVICVSDTKGTTKNPVVKAVASKKRKRSSGEARCVICDTNYEGIANAGGELFSSRCGHLFCMSCLKKLDPYKCTECNFKISNLWKIYL